MKIHSLAVLFTLAVSVNIGFPPANARVSKKVVQPVSKKAGGQELVDVYRTEEGRIAYMPVVSLKLGKPQKTVSADWKRTTLLNIQTPVESCLVLSYVDSVTGAPYLLLCDIRKTGEPNDSSNGTNRWRYETTKYPLQRIGSEANRFRIHDPQLSPNGRFISFKYYDPNDQFLDLKYRIYVLDTQKNNIKRISDRVLAFPVITWSPDSRYIAFLHGGDEMGDTSSYRSSSEEYLGPLKLYVYHLSSGKMQLVKTSDSLAQWSWSSRHSLLYTAMSDNDFRLWRERQEWELIKRSSSAREWKTLAPKAEKILNTSVRPNIWQYSPESQKSNLIIKDGIIGAPSPDNNKIAFFGSEDVTKPVLLRYGWAAEQQMAALSVAKLDGSERIALDRGNGFYPVVHWSADGKHLITFKLIQASPESKVEVKEWDTATKEFREVSEINISDLSGVPSSFLYPRIKLFRSSDRQWLYLSSWSISGQEKQDGFSRKKYQIMRLSPQNGTSETTITTGYVRGVDWQEAKFKTKLKA